MNRFDIDKARFPVAAISAVAATLVVSACGSAGTDGTHYEYIHTEGVELGYNMPYTPAIKVHSGRTVYLSGVTVAPVYHSHPHVPSEFDDLDLSPAGQARAAMENLKATVEAAGGQLSDIVQVTRFMVDQGANQDAVNAVMAEYWGDHRPASTSVEIPRLATDPRFILELDAVAIVPE